jgi:hypothetical protein
MPDPEGIAIVKSSVARTDRLRRYSRPKEDVAAVRASTPAIPFEASDAAIAASALSPGSKALLRGLLRVGSARVFPGGGAGIEYGSLLKTAARPEYVAGHVQEAAAHLHERRADLLLVPGMSGYPIGAMYAFAAQVPAILLKKSRLDEADPHAYPTGAFVIPSYTGEGEVVMHADPAAVTDVVEMLVGRKLTEQADRAAVEIELRVAGADDIIDKATMSQAVSESALAIGESALHNAISRHRARTGDRRPIDTSVAVVAWVTPLIKSYNRPHEHLWNALKVRPFAGIEVASIHLDPPAIAVSGIGALAFATAQHGEPQK